jgi:hypothetical protein
MSDGWRPGRRGFLLGAAALGSGAGAARAQTAGFAPSRPVTLVVNSPAGGSTDFSARLVAEPLSAKPPFAAVPGCPRFSLGSPQTQGFTLILCPA